MKDKFKGKKGITLVSLVITIIILLILAGITISMTLGDQGIFRKAKKASEMYVNAQWEEQEKINAIDTQLSTIFLSDYDISSAPKEELEQIRQNMEEMQELLNEKDKVLNDLRNQLENTTATEADILVGKTAYLQNGIKVGTMPNKGNIGTQTINPGGSYKIAAGYYSGGTVSANYASPYQVWQTSTPTNGGTHTWTVSGLTPGKKYYITFSGALNHSEFKGGFYAPRLTMTGGTLSPGIAKHEKCLSSNGEYYYYVYSAQFTATNASVAFTFNPNTSGSDADYKIYAQVIGTTP